MPAATKAKWAQLKVGLLALGALAILIVLIFLMSSSRGGLFKKSTEIYTYFSDSAAIIESSPVRLNGILIGKVKKIDLSGSPDPRKVVRITMSIDEDKLASIPVNSTTRLAAANLLGSKYINITKSQNAQSVKPGDELPSAESPEIDELLQSGNNALESLNGLIVRANNILLAVEQGKGTIGAFLVDRTLYNRTVEIADNIKSLTETLNRDDTNLGRLIHEDTLYQDIRGTVARFNTLVDGLNNGEGTAGKLLHDDVLYNQAIATIKDFRDLLAGLNRGEGTAGKLLKSDEIHQRFLALMGRLDTMLDKINTGEGTLGQLLINPQLYEDVDGMTRELHGLLKDFRANPTKFMRIRVSLF